MIKPRPTPKILPPPEAGTRTEGQAAVPEPHRIWQSLEAAYPADDAPAEDEHRLAGYIAVPLTIGLSLLLWGIILGLASLR